MEEKEITQDEQEFVNNSIQDGLEDTNIQNNKSINENYIENHENNIENDKDSKKKSDIPNKFEYQDQNNQNNPIPQIPYESDVLSPKVITSKSSKNQRALSNSLIGMIKNLNIPENQDYVDSNAISTRDKNDLNKLNPAENYYKVINSYLLSENDRKEKELNNFDKDNTKLTSDKESKAKEIKENLLVKSNTDKNMLKDRNIHFDKELNLHNIHHINNDDLLTYKFGKTQSKKNKNSYADLHKFILKNFDKIQIDDHENRIFPKNTACTPLLKVDSPRNLQKSISVCRLIPQEISSTPLPYQNLELKVSVLKNINSKEDHEINNFNSNNIHKKTYRVVSSAKSKRVQSASTIGLRNQNQTSDIKKLKYDLKNEIQPNQETPKNFMLISRKEADRLKESYSMIPNSTHFVESANQAFKKEFKAKTDLSKLFHSSSKNKIKNRIQQPIKLTDQLNNNQESYHFARMKEREEIFKLEISKHKMTVFNIMKSLNKTICDNDELKKHYSMKMTSKMIKQKPLNYYTANMLD